MQQHPIFSLAPMSRFGSTHHSSIILKQDESDTTLAGTTSEKITSSITSLVLNLLKSRHLHFGDGVVALDINANVGTHIIEWANYMKNWGTIIAVETQERIFYALAGNIALNNCHNAYPICPQHINHRDNNSVINQHTSFNIDPIIYPKLSRLDLLKINAKELIEFLPENKKIFELFRPIILLDHTEKFLAPLSEKLKENQYRILENNDIFFAIHETDPSLNTLTEPMSHQINHDQPSLIFKSERRPIFLMAPHSRIGMKFGYHIAQSCRHIVAAIDDHYDGSIIYGVPRWSSSQFITYAKRYPNAIAIDMSSSIKGQSWVKTLCEESEIEYCDWVFYPLAINLDITNQEQFDTQLEIK